MKFANHSWWKECRVDGVVDIVQADEDVVIAHDGVEKWFEGRAEVAGGDFWRCKGSRVTSSGEIVAVAGRSVLEIGDDAQVLCETGGFSRLLLQISAIISSEDLTGECIESIGDGTPGNSAWWKRNCSEESVETGVDDGVFVGLENNGQSGTSRRLGASAAFSAVLRDLVVSIRTVKDYGSVVATAGTPGLALEIEVWEIDADFVASGSGDGDSLVLICLVYPIWRRHWPGWGEGVGGEADVDFEGGVGSPDSVLFCLGGSEGED